MPDPISWAYSWPYFAAALAAGYFLGAIPFGLVLTRLAGLGDIRELGSGNIGATNVLRTGRKGLAVATLLLDGGKGAAAVLIAWNFGPDITVTAAAGVLIGHCFPVWLKFRGGKGVATALGIYLALAPPVGALACLSWLAVAAAVRYSSLASLTAMGLAPVFAFFLADPQQFELAIFVALVTVLRHHANIRRLLKGEESKIGRERDQAARGGG
ncbi:MAG: glycerol-3-phosphate 1-O-acyltransferase PlsY [Kiloniellales bacterium]